MKFDINKVSAPQKGKFDLESFDPKYVGDYTKEMAKKALKKNTKELKKIQEKFYADDTYSLLIILQASDAAGKDGAIKHVMGGINPQGCRVHSFKTPSKFELDHDFMWRHYLAFPERGMIEIFNRSYYENVLITKVHPEFVMNERIPEVDSVGEIDKEFWQSRYERINAFENHLYRSGTKIVKFFLNLSKEEQKNRFLARLDTPDKQWKFSPADLEERKYWKKYRKAFEDMIGYTNTKEAPWYIIPADNKWFSRIAIGKIIHKTMDEMDLQYPEPLDAELLKDAKQKLMSEE